MSKIRSILFVCTGNSCRSVMAEGLLRKFLQDRGREGITVTSAGIMAPVGFPPTGETIAVLSEEGIDLSGHRATRITYEMIKTADLILAMELSHKNEILNLMPAAASKTFLLKEFGMDAATGQRGRLGISDPIGRPIEEYRRCYAEIKGEIERIMESL